MSESTHEKLERLQVAKLEREEKQAAEIRREAREYNARFESARKANEAAKDAANREERFAPNYMDY